MSATATTLNQASRALPLNLVADPTTALEPGVAANDATDVAQSVVLNTSRGEIEFTAYPDGSIVLWSPTLVLSLPADESERLTAMLQRNKATPFERAPFERAPVAQAPALPPAPVTPVQAVCPAPRGEADLPAPASSALSCLALLTPSGNTKRVSQHISLEAQGWGVNVGANLRYYYQSRDLARCARVNHPVGRFGRVA